MTNNKPEFNVSSRIKFYREKRGITVNKLANLAGVSQSYVRDLEMNKDANPSIGTLEVLCNALGVTLRDFFEDEKPSNPSADMLYEDILGLSSSQKKAISNMIHEFQNYGNGNN